MQPHGGTMSRPTLQPTRCRFEMLSFDKAMEVVKKRWTGLVIGAMVVAFLAFDSAVKLLRLQVTVEGTTRLG